MILFLSSDLVSFKQLTLFSRQVFVIYIWKLGKFSFYFNYTEVGVKAEYQILPWGESQTQVFHALSTVISYLPRSNVLWWQTLELLSQTCFLLLPSGSYGYDRNCWFQYMMIINIKINFPLPVWALCPKS